MRVLFRVEAGPQVGLGHLRRSLSLAEALRRQGIESRFMVNDDPQALTWASGSSFPVRHLREAASFGAEDLRRTLEEVRSEGIQMVVVDFDETPRAYLEGLRESDAFVVLRDDSALSYRGAHLVMNGNADAKELGYSAQGEEIRFLLGPRYAVLPQEFWQQAYPRRARRQVKRLLLMAGGADTQGFLPDLLKLTEELPGEFSIQVVVGPFFRNEEEIRQAIQEIPRPVKLAMQPSSLSELLREADLAITAAGQTLYELACAGCPVVAVEVASNQRGQLRALNGNGCVASAGSVADSDWKAKVREAASSLMKDPALRQRQTQAGQELIDGQGALRVAREMLTQLSYFKQASVSS